MTGTTWVEESGFLTGPVMITNTHSVGVVRDAAIQWRVTHGQGGPDDDWWSLPVVAETWDGWLNDINGFHVKPEDALHAIDSAHTGPVEEGNVGGGTGMICNEFKGGIGTASRKLSAREGGYTVGVLVQCNYGRRPNLRITGVPVGEEIPEERPYTSASFSDTDHGSIIVVVDRCALACPSIEAHSAARHAGARPPRKRLGKWVRRHFHCVFDGEFRRGEACCAGATHDVAQRPDESGLRS